MRLAIIGGGISGLSTVNYLFNKFKCYFFKLSYTSFVSFHTYKAYYINKFSLPIAEVLLYEGSSRFGGWINSKQVEFNGDKFHFEKGPRTLRLATGELKEMNSLQIASELNLGPSVEVIPNSHPAARNRYIYYNNKINAVSKCLYLYIKRFEF